MPKGISTKGYRRIKVVESDAAWKRVHQNNRYKEKGILLNDFKYLCQQNCHFCGQPPKRMNPFGETFELYLKSYKRAKYSLTQIAWHSRQWINYNGIDKKIPCDNYKDLNNLVTCCKTCNFMKGLIPYENFLFYISKIYNNLILKDQNER